MELFIQILATDLQHINYWVNGGRESVQKLVNDLPELLKIHGKDWHHFSTLMDAVEKFRKAETQGIGAKSVASFHNSAAQQRSWQKMSWFKRKKLEKEIKEENPIKIAKEQAIKVILSVCAQISR